jgi:hypothetical protein
MNEPTCLGWKIQTYDQSPQPHYHIHTPFIKIMAIQQSKLDSHIQISSYTLLICWKFSQMKFFSYIHEKKYSIPFHVWNVNIEFLEH